MTYEYFTEFDSLITVRLPHTSTSFRPAATSNVQEVAERNACMELAEVKMLGWAAEPYLGSAAHPNKDSATVNAISETLERLSIAAWWAYRRNVIEKLASKNSATIFPKDQGFHVSLGRVPAAFDQGNAVICIASNRHEYPYAVSGTAFDLKLDCAIQKSIQEAAQSWVGSQWLRKAINNGSPGWDLNELSYRQQQIDSAAPRQDNGSVTLQSSEPYLPADFRIKHSSIGHTAIAWVEHPQVKSTQSFHMAQLLAQPQEKPQIFSRPNW